VKGSTSISELLDPEELRNIIEKSYQISLPYLFPLFSCIAFPN